VAGYDDPLGLTVRIAHRGNQSVHGRLQLLIARQPNFPIKKPRAPGTSRRDSVANYTTLALTFLRNATARSIRQVAKACSC
jgi:hypothetical protein